MTSNLHAFAVGHQQAVCSKSQALHAGYGGLLPGNKRKVAEELPERIFSDSSVQSS